MAKGYRKSGVDFDSLFDPDVVGDGPTAANLRSGGTPLKYAKLSYGSKGPDVGYREGGVDVSNKWAAIGTASYAGRGGVPDNVLDSQVVPPTGGSANAFVQYKRNGGTLWSDGPGTSAGTWAPGGSTAGDIYDIAFTTLSGPDNGGTISGGDGVWYQVNTDRSCGLSRTYSGGPEVVTNASMNCKIRRRSDGVVIVNYNFTLTATVTSDG